jgi:ribose 1,5-bisphosphokinase PhnN
VVLVTAPCAVLAQRLGARGRESAEDIARRLARDAGSMDLAPDCVIENVGPVNVSIDQLASFLSSLAARARMPTGAA